MKSCKTPGGILSTCLFQKFKLLEQVRHPCSSHSKFHALIGSWLLSLDQLLKREVEPEYTQLPDLS
jgi:hypothetical protein